MGRPNKRKLQSREAARRSRQRLCGVAGEMEGVVEVQKSVSGNGADGTTTYRSTFALPSLVEPSDDESEESNLDNEMEEEDFAADKDFTPAEVEIFKQMMLNADNQDKTHIPYYRGSEPNRVTTWRHQKRQDAMGHHAQQFRTITSFFRPFSDPFHEAPVLPTIPEHPPAGASVTSKDSDIRAAAIKNFEVLLKGKNAPTDQDEARHRSVLAFLSPPQQRPWLSKQRNSGDAAAALNRSLKTARALCRWEAT